MSGLAVLGATGSIGRSTLDVAGRHPDRYPVVALAAHRDVETMLDLCRRHGPRLAAMADADAARELERRLAVEGLKTEVAAGPAGLEAVATHPEAAQVMAAIVGAAGLPPALAAVRAGKRLLLANKEALVVAGRLFMEEVGRAGVTVLPIDSEHNAIYQCLPPGSGSLEAKGVSRILLTASGGPFRTWPVERLARVTPEEACAHPNWNMGRKISVDSATLMNKGLEVIEAHWLFGAEPDRIHVVVHPQSIVHSLVQYVDGSVLAQMGNPDMRTPIAHALAWPERIDAGVAPLDLFDVGRLDFEAPDLKRFPCLGLAFRAVREGGTAPAVLNAANEVAVAAFLNRRIGFLDIPRVIEGVMEAMPAAPVASLEQLLAVDAEARRRAEAQVKALEDRA